MGRRQEAHPRADITPGLRTKPDRFPKPVRFYAGSPSKHIRRVDKPGASAARRRSASTEPLHRANATCLIRNPFRRRLRVYRQPCLVDALRISTLPRLLNPVMLCDPSPQPPAPPTACLGRNLIGWADVRRRIPGQISRRVSQPNRTGFRNLSGFTRDRPQNISVGWISPARAQRDGEAHPPNPCTGPTPLASFAIRSAEGCGFCGSPVWWMRCAYPPYQGYSTSLVGQ